MTKSNRATFPTRKFRLVSELARESAMAALRNVPLDADKPIECQIREEVKARKPDQNALMWAGPLRDIAEQGYVEGKTYSAKVWHEHFKEQYLPEDFDPSLCKEGYQKWGFKPNGERLLVGSTKELTVRGFALYLQQIEAYAQVELGVQLHASPRMAA